MREVFTNPLSIKILLLFGFFEAVFFGIEDFVSKKYAKYCAKKAQYNCNNCNVCDCKYRYCGKRYKHIESGVETDVRKNR